MSALMYIVRDMLSTFIAVRLGETRRRNFSQLAGTGRSWTRCPRWRTLGTITAMHLPYPRGICEGPILRAQRCIESAPCAQYEEDQKGETEANYLKESIRVAVQRHPGS